MEDRKGAARREIASHALDRGMAAAFGAAEPRSVLDAMGIAASRILLRDQAADESPVVRPPGPGATGPAALRAAGRYQIQGEIARGGVGIVVKGHDVDLGRDVAVKVLREEHSGNRDIVRRFVEEAQIGGQLQHPGIVPVYELGVQDDGKAPWFAMKLVKGRTFSALLAERRSVSDDRRRMLGIFEQVCQTVAYAHSRGVVHRDLKPNNVMIGAFGEVQVVDWGFAKVLRQGGTADERRHVTTAELAASVIATVRSTSPDAHSVAGSVMGTAPYMPPEQAKGNVDQLDERSDVFSLGAMLCEILTGEPAYGGDPSTLILRAARAELDDARARLAACGADAEIVAICTSCLVAAKEARPRDAGVLARDVGGYLSAAESRIADARIAETAARRTQKFAIAVGVSVAVALVVSLLFWYDAEGQRQRAEDRERDALNARSEAEARSRRLERVAYAGVLHAAADALDASEPEDVAWRMDETEPAHRGVEFDYLRFRAGVPAPEVLETSSGVPADVRHSPDGTRIAVASISGDVDVLDAAGGRRICTASPAGHRVVWADGGSAIVTLREDGTLCRFDAATGAPTHEAHHGDLALGLAASPDGALVASGGGDGEVRISRSADLSEVRRIPAGLPCRALRFDPAGERIVVALAAGDGDDGGAQVFDVASGRALTSRMRCVELGRSLPCTSADFSPSGGTILACYAGGRSLLWSVAHESVIHELEPHRFWTLGFAYTRAAGFTPDGRWALTAGTDGIVRVHECATGRCVGRIAPRQAAPTLFTGLLRGARVAPDGLSIVSWGHGARVYRWRWLDLPLPYDLPASVARRYVSSLDLSSPGDVVYAVDDAGRVTAWNLRTGRAVFEPVTVPGEPSEHGIVRLPPDALAVVGGDLALHVLDAATGRPRRTVTAAPELVAECRARRVYPTEFAILDGGRGVVAALGNAFSVRDAAFRAPILVYDLAQDTVRSLPGHRGCVSSILLSSDQSTLFSAGTDQYVRAWDVATGAQRWERLESTAERLPSTTLARGEDGGLLVGLCDGSVQSLDPESGAPRWAARVHAVQDPVFRLATDPASGHLLVLGADGTLALWDRDRQLLLTASLPMPSVVDDWECARVAADLGRVVVTMPGGWVRTIPLRAPSGVAALAATRDEAEAVRIATDRILVHGTDADAAAAALRADRTLPRSLADRAAAVAARIDLPVSGFAEAASAVVIPPDCTPEEALRAVAIVDRCIAGSEPGTNLRCLQEFARALCLLRAGRAAEVEETLSHAERTVVALADFPGRLHQVPALRAVAAMMRGRTDEARAHLAEARRRFAAERMPAHDTALELAVRTVEGDEP